MVARILSAVLCVHVHRDVVSETTDELAGNTATTVSLIYS